MKAQIQSPRGTRDLLPSEIQTWQWIESVARSMFETYGYQEIRTPIFESTDLFIRGVGDTTDIVEKEMYTFTDKGKRSISLRPDGTAPVVRAMLQNRLMEGAAVLKLYYVGQLFRYRRPQAGRYREYWTVGVEAFGTDNPTIDAEVISLASRFFSRLGLKDVTLQLNSIGDRACRPKYVQDLRQHADRHRAGLCGDCKRRYERNPLRILDCKNGCREALGDMPQLPEYLCASCREHFDAVKRCLQRLVIGYDEDPYLVRGLDYYSRTTFEFFAGGLGAQLAIGGAGRYDYLVEELGGKPTPGIGFGLGVDRIILALAAQNVAPPTQPPVDIYVAVQGDAAMPVALELAQQLRDNGARTDLEYNGRSLRAQMKIASRLKTRYVVVIGEDEISRQAALVRDMESGEQRSIAFAQLAEVLGPEGQVGLP